AGARRAPAFDGRWTVRSFGFRSWEASADERPSGEGGPSTPDREQSSAWPVLRAAPMTNQTVNSGVTTRANQVIRLRPHGTGTYEVVPRMMVRPGGFALEESGDCWPAHQRSTPSSFSTALAELPTLSMTRCSCGRVMPKCLHQYLTTVSSLILILPRSGCGREAICSPSQSGCTDARPLGSSRQGPHCRTLGNNW